MNDEELIKKYVAIDKQKDALNKLKSGYPIQYIIGNVDFYNINVLVDERVLIPRFETEYLVEKIIKYSNTLNIVNPNILEIGTGSGCISIALKKNMLCNITAIDISNDALSLAKENAKRNNTKIDFINNDVHDYKENIKFDIIVSNPPYVAYDKVVDEKTKYEPQNALYAPNNGLYFYELILSKFKNSLTDNYLIAFEIDDNMGNKIKEIAHKYLPNSFVKIEKDYNNYERYAFIYSKNI